MENVYLPAQAVGSKEKESFKPDLYDFVFALVAFALGYLFSRWVFFSWKGWGVAVFTTAYLLTVTAYMMKKGAHTKGRAAWFWASVTWAVGMSYLLWENAGFTGTRAMFLFCSAVYYVLLASGRAIMGKTGNYLLIDGINATILMPFRNFLNQYMSFSALRKEGKRGKGLSVFIGIVLALFLLVCLIPMLERADSGGFKVVLGFFAEIFDFEILEVLFYAFFAIPVAAYLYGLASGAAHNRGADTIKPESAKKAVAALRFFQPATVHIALGAVCGLYLVFILCQTPYFFSAFTGRRPEGWLVYSEYARQGFFELCGIAAINLIILTIGNVTCKKRRVESVVIKAYNIGLAAITLVLIATAFSKMALYIRVYGLTMPRLLPCVFMVFLAVVFVALIALQKREFSIVRFALATGAAILCILCLSNPDALVVRYNTDRYLAGTLRDYDIDILYRAGSAGVLPALEVYESATDMNVKDQLAAYLYNMHMRIENEEASGIGQGAHTRGIEAYRAHKMLREFFSH